MNEIQQWLTDPARDYAAGVSLFARHSKNKVLVHYFQNGTARFRMAKLVYEMGKVAKMTNMERRVEPHGRAAQPASQPRTTSLAATVETPLPPFILAAKKEIASLYALIDKRHRELYDLGTSNAADVVRHRKKLLDGRKPAIERADRLYRLKEDWFVLENGPGRERVAKEIQEMLAAPWKEQPTIEIVEMHGRASNQLRPAVGSLSDLDLSKRRSALRSSITKTQNMLQYQTIRKGDTPAPMPDGPKRDEFKKKLEALKSEYNAIVKELERRSK